MTARCLALEEVGGAEVGGKAAGLSRLIELGLSVPPGFVVIGAAPGRLPADLQQRYAALGGGHVAVRSSALDEDGVAASFAGQYETVLNVQGPDAVARAVQRCLESARSERAEAYRAERGADDRPAQMCVVVQRMIQPRTAGVVFTVDPITGRRDRLVVDAVAGLGDSLVSGEASSDHYEVDPTGEAAFELWAGDVPLLEAGELRRLASEARAAAERHGCALDLEWALDDHGTVHWLQARPVTTLGSDPNELDTPLPAPDDVLTRCNIGEMMPGAVTPLTWSLTGRGVDFGMQSLMKRNGALHRVNAERPLTVAMAYGQLFINLTRLAVMCRHVAGATPEGLCLSICGRVVHDVRTGPRAPRWRRALNGVRYGLNLLRAARNTRPMAASLRAIEFDAGSDAAALYRSIDRQVITLYRAYEYHLASSAISGALTPALLQILAGNDLPDERHHARLARLLAGADRVESADIASGMDRVIAQVLAHPEGRARVGEAAAAHALAWLESDASGSAGRAWRQYMAQHGHRAVRELELRQAEWATQPLPLVESMQVALRGHRRDRAREAAAPEPSPKRIRLLVRAAHGGVRRREATKSLLVATTTSFKRAYRRLGDKLREEGRLPDADCVFFLLHEEIGRLLAGDTELATRAVQRRKTLPLQMGLDLPDICVGAPEPQRRAPVANGDSVVGRPVSCGRVRGRVRVVHSVQDAAQLEAGDILVARTTDAGWTPYFGILGGLVTDLGSAMSHGAVVAREYGLPCVVDARSATHLLETGDWVVLDGDRGTVEVVDSDGERSA